MDFNREEIVRIKTILDYHVGSDHEQKPVSEQIRILSLKKRRFLFISGINVLALLLFGYWFFSGITQLAGWVFWVLAIVFILNLLSVGYQKRQIEQAIKYLNSDGMSRQ